jgi:hypothetical protein
VVPSHGTEEVVLPHLHLQFFGDTMLLGYAAGVEPGAAQFLDAAGSRPHRRM